MTYFEFRAERNRITIEALALFSKGNKRALHVGRARITGLRDHFKAVAVRGALAGLSR